MRHKLGYRKLNRTSEHRKALFKNMLNSLIKYEQITTTLPKAKDLKPIIDKVITLGKKNNLQSKRKFICEVTNQNLQLINCQKFYHKDMEREKVVTLELLELDIDMGDDAPMAVIELVDRDILAKKIDIKKKPQESEKSSPDTKIKDSDKKTKSKK